MGTAKRIIVSATGFPGTTKTWNHIQGGYSEPLEGLAQFVGDDVIVSGVTIDGDTVSNGYISLNGTIYRVEGGAITDPEDWGFVMQNVEENALYDTTGSGTGSESLPAYKESYLKLMNNQSDYECTMNSLTRLKTAKQLTNESTINPMLFHYAGYAVYSASDSALFKKISITYDNPISGSYNLNFHVRSMSTIPTDEELLYLTTVSVAVISKTSSGFSLIVKKNQADIDFCVEYWVLKPKF